MNSFGRIFRVSIFGESHGPLVGVVVDGLTAGIPLRKEDFMPDLLRRKSGREGTTPRLENDLPELLTGVFNDKSTGAPLTIVFPNKNTDSSAYNGITDVPRPGHADFVAYRKFGGYNDHRGGGHFSGRLTLALVAAGVLAKKMIAPVSVSASLIEAGGEKDIELAIIEAVAAHDSIGGIVECRAEGLPAGLGEPFFDSLESLISHIVFSVPAIKGIEFGSGFHAASMRGSEHNDPIIDQEGKTGTNNAGGINGGISNGNELVFRVAVKPTSSIKARQVTLNVKKDEMVELELQGRHDVCIALRVPVVIEAALAIVLADLMMIEQQRGRLVKTKA